MHLSDAKHVELSKPITNVIGKDWIQFPQLSDYGWICSAVVKWLRALWQVTNCSAHFERRTKSTLHQSSFPRKENKYGWITTVAVENDNTTKVKIGLLICNLLVTSSLRIDSHAVTTNGVVELGPNTNNFFPKDIVSIYLNEESIKLAKIMIKNKATTLINSWNYLVQLRQIRSKFHCLSTYTLCRSFNSISTDITFQPYTIWFLYYYDSNQSLESQSQKLSLMFQRIALSVMVDGAAVRLEMNTFKNLYSQLNENYIKNTIKPILDLEQGESIFIINNTKLSQRL
ncbi:uncharacterized protein BX663DRAFT_544146 [Cokeromyces recurvatus]|uniref:uncharacterized protein n=1 Tax=Cokeromyces recurvatus TaxID=90255 RepID=UPI00221F0235|nr:uncharacterized protein BX663DRAFT_544146 [Cokeromyces recurvatus]KAI7901380.1 hypothetical protein BX663DRAFT_544146 [Cokeromyces recurvatus]